MRGGGRSAEAVSIDHAMSKRHMAGQMGFGTPNPHKIWRHQVYSDRKSHIYHQGRISTFQNRTHASSNTVVARSRIQSNTRDSRGPAPRSHRQGDFRRRVRGDGRGQLGARF